jgi:hypothetical protein
MLAAANTITRGGEKKCTLLSFAGGVKKRMNGVHACLKTMFSLC